MIKQFAKLILKGTGYQVVKDSTLKKTAFKNMDSEFESIYQKCAPFTMTTVERMYSLFTAIKYTVENDISGDIVECGVWKGGSSMLCALTLKQLGATDRKLYLYDTYSGMPEPIDKDKEAFTGNDAMEKWKERQIDGNSDWCHASIEEVQENLISTGYPEDNIIFIKGKVEETIPNRIPEEIALLRLDTDFYESTKHELEHLYPKLSERGTLIIDDYGYWAGAKEAVDEYISDNGIKLLLHRIDETGRVAIKLT